MIHKVNCITYTFRTPPRVPMRLPINRRNLRGRTAIGWIVNSTTKHNNSRKCDVDRSCVRTYLPLVGRSTCDRRCVKVPIARTFSYLHLLALLYIRRLARTARCITSSNEWKQKAVQHIFDSSLACVWVWRLRV